MLFIPTHSKRSGIDGSSREDIAVGFRGRKATTFIGEESYGLLTGNDLIQLPFDISLTLPTGYIADRNTVYTESIQPDFVIEKQDDFENLLNDANIQEAIEFINSNQ